MYKAKRKTAQVDFLFNAQSATDLVKRAHYLSLIAERDDADMSVSLALKRAGEKADKTDE